MTTVSRFSRQNDVGLRALNVVLLENSRDMLRPITKRMYRDGLLTFNSHLKALYHVFSIIFPQGSSQEGQKWASYLKFQGTYIIVARVKCRTTF